MPTCRHVCANGLGSFHAPAGVPCIILGSLDGKAYIFRGELPNKGAVFATTSGRSNCSTTCDTVLRSWTCRAGSIGLSGPFSHSCRSCSSCRSGRSRRTNLSGRYCSSPGVYILHICRPGDSCTRRLMCVVKRPLRNGTRPTHALRFVLHVYMARWPKLPDGSMICPSWAQPHGR